MLPVFVASLSLKNSEDRIPRIHWLIMIFSYFLKLHKKLWVSETAGVPPVHVRHQPSVPGYGGDGPDAASPSSLKVEVAEFGLFRPSMTIYVGDV